MIKRNKNLLMLIDFQKDFCLPEGSLYVEGAESDTERITQFVRKNMSVIDHIILTSDFHQVVNISHSCFWINKQGKHPEPYTQISYDDILENKWMPLIYKEKAIEYIRKLELQGEFKHTIWPEHCIAGSDGSAIVNNIMSAVIEWARQGNFYDIILKGLYPVTEHFGALRANIPDPDIPETGLNVYLIETIKKFENIIIAGEAKSHCVANTLKQLMEIEGLKSRIIILEDCMSPVKGFENIADNIYNNAKQKGAIFIKSQEFYHI